MFAVLKDAIQAIDKIKGDKVVLHELPSFMKSMGIQLSDKDFQEALKQVSVDGEYMRKESPLAVYPSGNTGLSLQCT